MTDPISEKRNADLGIYGGYATGDSEDLSGIDWFDALQEPTVDTRNDPLAAFVMARVIELELEPRGEVKAVYDEVGGPMAHRYAKHVRRDCVVFRRIVVRYMEAREALDAAEHPAGRSALGLLHGGISEAMREIACRWSDHREFHDEWRLG